MTTGSMKCPECGVPLVRETSGAVEVDVCKGCEGIWFDAGELEKYRAQAPLGSMRVGNERAAFVPAGGAATKICPRCGTGTVELGTLGKMRSVARCSSCRGFFAFDVSRLGVRGLLEVLTSFIA